MKTFTEFVLESKMKLNDMEAEYVTQVLSDADINSIVDEDTVIVDKNDIKETKKILKKIGYSNLKVKAK